MRLPACGYRDGGNYLPLGVADAFTQKPNSGVGSANSLSCLKPHGHSNDELPRLCIGETFDADCFVPALRILSDIPLRIGAEARHPRHRSKFRIRKALKGYYPTQRLWIKAQGESIPERRTPKSSNHSLTKSAQSCLMPSHT
jgi:hypothetical protein